MEHLPNVTHEPGECAGEWCTIHRPSPASESVGYRHWRWDRGIMERICEHGIGHYDYDQEEFHIKLLGKAGAKAQAVHGCDGCCRKDYK